MLQLMNQLVIPLALTATVSHVNAKALAYNWNRLILTYRPLMLILHMLMYFIIINYMHVNLDGLALLVCSLSLEL